MRVASRGSAAFSLVMMVIIATGCGDDESGSNAGAAGGGAGGAAGSDAGGDGSSGADAGKDVELDAGADVVNACAQCGAARSASDCAAALAACEANGECQKMRSCVYGSKPGCPLGPTGAACVAECVRASCSSHAQVQLFYAAELCAFCDGACGAECPGYCSGFVLDAATAVCWSLEGGVDGGEEAEPELDAGVDVSTD
jgi:hypothetical protein